MLKFGGLKFWSCAVRSAGVLGSSRPSFGPRVRYIFGFSCKDVCNSSLFVQKAGYTGGYQAGGYGQEGYANRNSGFEERYGSQGRYGNRNPGFGGRPRSQGFAGDGLNPIKYENMQPIKKELYQEHESVTNRSQTEIDDYLKNNQVNVEGEIVQRPIFNFGECNFPEPILKGLSKFDGPTVIQAVSWPLVLSGKDVVSIARTGSGKTLGFVLPAIMHILNQPARSPRDGPVVLIVLPTRELCQQVGEVAKQYCDLMKLEVACVYGGAPKDDQARPLRIGVDMLVGTPGRLMDFLEMGVTNLRRCSFLVMDEADRMLDMGFEPQIRKVVGQIRPDRQTLMFSATWPQDVQHLATDFQKEPVFLRVGSMHLSANHSIDQHVEVIEPHLKQVRLFELLEKIYKEPDNKTIVFVNRKFEAEKITREIRRKGFRALAIHGGKEQPERDLVLNEFRSDKTKILVATDVAARGLDVDDVKVVINYDYPTTSEDYVHRIGRTGRAEKTGTSYTFFTSEDSRHAAAFVKVLEESKQEIPEALRQPISAESFERKGSRYSKSY